MKDDLRNNLVSKVIEELNGRQRLGGFNKYQIRDIFQGVVYEMMNVISVERVGEG